MHLWDHFKCSMPGCITMGYRKGPPHDLYKGSSVRVDASSGLFFVAMQVSLDTHKTLLAKHHFETFMHDFGHRVRV